MSNNSVVDLKNDNEGTPSYAQTLKIKKDDDKVDDSKIVYFPVGSWD